MIVGLVGTFVCLLSLIRMMALAVHVGDWVRGLLFVAFALAMVVRVFLPAVWLLADLGSARQADKHLHETQEAGDWRGVVVARLRRRLLRWQRR